MKKSVALAILVLIALNAYGKEIAIPDAEYLISKTLDFNYIIGGATIKFLKGNAYKIRYGSEGWYWYNEGNYELKNGKILLHPVKCLSDEDGSIMDCNDSMGEAICTLYETDKTLYFNQYLEVKSLRKRSVFTQDPRGGENYIEFEIKESRVIEGATRKIENVPVIVMGLKKGITTDNLKIRKKPSINSESIKYRAGLYGDDAREYDFVPNNTEIIIIARSLEKEKVKNWTNYWYYIKAGIHDGVWAYGEFIKFK